MCWIQFAHRPAIATLSDERNVSVKRDWIPISFYQQSACVQQNMPPVRTCVTWRVNSAQFEKRGLQIYSAHMYQFAKESVFSVWIAMHCMSCWRRNLNMASCVSSWICTLWNGADLKHSCPHPNSTRPTTSYVHTSKQLRISTANKTFITHLITQLRSLCSNKLDSLSIDYALFAPQRKRFFTSLQ